MKRFICLPKRFTLHVIVCHSLFFTFSCIPTFSVLSNAVMENTYTVLANEMTTVWVCGPAGLHHSIVPGGCTQLDTYYITPSSLAALMRGICWWLPPWQGFFPLLNLHFNSGCATCSFHRDNVCQAHGNNTEWEPLPLLVYHSVCE